MSIRRYPTVSKGSLRALAYEIKNEMSGGITTDDNVYPIRLIESEIKHQYGLAQWEEDKLNMALGIEPNAQRVQIFPCIPLKDNTDFYCKCTKTGGKFKKATLPKMMEWRGQSYIKYVGNTDMDLPFTTTNNIQEINATDSVLTKPSYFLSGNNLYVRLPTDYKAMCEITVMGIPESPTNSNGLCFDVWNAEWNVAEYMKSIIKAKVKQQFTPLLLNTTQMRDLRGNSQDGNQFVTTQTP
ncbi:hypothetical protein [Dyadobacter sp. CY312]|uniref:hypothetical protein n=1 Tax=Dyadobacter sp. CY312 TaxID=2907303 RepID=UPI001F407CF5|nr:hypothetical protein [Dyadobacter sp. CY312]MCE7039230.1 hypothetical protein [Dyadobacter sp. CY312]